ncbi:gonadotropin subunit beta-1-like [Gouania willdenowi]|uniref:Gonadotropin subunit beta-1-like n=1 Tax=Gouania willdenowi TaxID=441366 RepID=A0A8C5DCB0_GOUWI|nr:gonadotropin subunit beta-1-like [Gouania willdenowi]
MLRMLLVVMVTMLSLGGAMMMHGCSFGCQPTNVSIPVESCGLTKSVVTTVCVGQCYHQDSVLLSSRVWDKQNSCNGDWFYEVAFIDGCPLAVTYPVARKCECTVCNPGNTYCGPFPGDMPSCPSLIYLTQFGQ